MSFSVGDGEQNLYHHNTHLNRPANIFPRLFGTKLQIKK
uniref:Uncharacterized protein n=1 Tax=Anguilla anguilla TaxID=7936 RepID=A0A0E9TE94_ANGAN